MDADILIIGAGPSGSVSAAALIRAGLKVIVLEKQHFPRFVIGESLLPSLMPLLDGVGMGDVVRHAGFQYKHGATFTWGNRNVDIDFRHNWGDLNGEVYEVKRAEFDKLLIDTAESMGAEVRYGQTVTAYEDIGNGARLTVENEEGEVYQLTGKFVFDASGYGRVLPQLLDLEVPVDLSPRHVWATHIRDNITASDYNRDFITIATSPDNRQQWSWLIPFSDGTASVGYIATPEEQETNDPREHLKRLMLNIPRYKYLLENAEWDIGMPVRGFGNYSKGVKSLVGEHYVLIGNSGDFLDPVFSSGIAIAIYSAVLASQLITRQLKGEMIDWHEQFEEEVRFGIRVFRTYVKGWYDGRFQDVIYAITDNSEIHRYIASILGGYAWDRTNPFVTDSERRLNMVANAVREYGLLTTSEMTHA